VTENKQVIIFLFLREFKGMPLFKNTLCINLSNGPTLKDHHSCYYIKRWHIQYHV